MEAFNELNFSIDKGVKTSVQKNCEFDHQKSFYSIVSDGAV